MFKNIILFVIILILIIISIVIGVTFYDKPIVRNVEITNPASWR